jgi:proton-coupled amino acid transporter
MCAGLGIISWYGNESLDKIVAVVGCFACIPLSFIYPALFHAHISTSKYVLIKDWCIVIFGTLAMIFVRFKFFDHLDYDCYYFAMG